MFFRRGVSDTDDRWLQVRLWLFGVGAVLALLGMGLQNDWLIGAAGLVLAGGILLRFTPRPGSEDDADRSD
jgi:hypothetical protein